MFQEHAYGRNSSQLHVIEQKEDVDFPAEKK